MTDNQTLNVIDERSDSPSFDSDNNNDCKDCNGEHKGDVWIQCNICLQWYHCFCVNVPECEINEIDQFHCRHCAPKCGPSIMKPILNRHRYDRTQYAENLPIQIGTGAFIEELIKRKFPIFEQVHIMEGDQINFDYFASYGFKIPILVNNLMGLNLKIPPNFSLDYLTDKLGEDYMLEVIDVHYQQTTKMKLMDLVNAMKDTTNRAAILNCISLELSSTCLARQVEPPLIVRKISWVENCWDSDDLARPQVSKYCLISMKHSYTDFHIDFSGTSVWYHILKGKKLFYFIEPTPENLKKYEEWMNKENYTEIFFPDMIESKCSAFLLNAGQTMFIPTGWIHAVYTPEDSIVFGGNFLHALNIPLQMEIFELEGRIGTTDKFKFPYFEYTHWFAQEHTAKLLLKLAKKTPKYSRKNRGFRSVVKGTKMYIKYLKHWYAQSKQQVSDEKRQSEESYLVPNDFDCEKAIEQLQKLLDQYRHVDRNNKNGSNKPSTHNASVPKNEIPSYSIFKKAFEATSDKPSCNDKTPSHDRPSAHISTKTNKSQSTDQLPCLKHLLKNLSTHTSSAGEEKPRKKRFKTYQNDPDWIHVESPEKANKLVKHTSDLTIKINISNTAPGFFTSRLSTFKIPKRKREETSDHSDVSDLESISNRPNNTPETSPDHACNLTAQSTCHPNSTANSNTSSNVDSGTAFNASLFTSSSDKSVSFMQSNHFDSQINNLEHTNDFGKSKSPTASRTSPSILSENSDSKPETDSWPELNVYYGNSIYSH